MSTLAERFWEKVDKRGPDECWPWTAAVNNRGYGKIFDSRVRSVVGAHRIAYELATGEQPGPWLVCHRCDNRICVNPLHLWLGTYRDNTQDMFSKGRQGHRPDPKIAAAAQLRSAGLKFTEIERLTGASASSVASYVWRNRTGPPTFRCHWCGGPATSKREDARNRWCSKSCHYKAQWARKKATT